jgi:hypothetical protein
MYQQTYWIEDSASTFSAGLLGGDRIQGNGSKCSHILMMLVFHFVTVWSEFFSSAGIIYCNSKL